MALLEAATEQALRVDPATTRLLAVARRHLVADAACLTRSGEVVTVHE